MTDSGVDFNALLDLCRRLPHATEAVKSDDDLVFSVGGRMFAVFDAKGGTRVAFKTTPDTFALLTAREGIRPAPSAARFHWVRLEAPEVLPEDQVRELLRESYHLVALSLPARIRRQLAEE